MKLIILDRDGVINEDSDDYIKSPDEWIPIPGSLESIGKLSQNNFRVVIITNQSAINRKLLDVNTLETIHEHFQKYLKKNNTSIDAIYYCPHLPEENCSCRKPKPGLILNAAKDFKINLKKSWMIGDSKKDIDAANSAGCNSILLKPNQRLLDVIKEFINTF